MKNNLLLLISLMFITSCSTVETTDYSPLYKYRGLSPEKVLDYETSYLSDDPYATFTNLKAQFLDANVPGWESEKYVLHGANVLCISNHSTNILYSFTDTNGIRLLDANDLYVMYLDESTLKVVDTSGSQLYGCYVITNQISARIGHGSSTLITVSTASSLDNYAKHKTYTYDIVSKEKIDLNDSRCILGFSKSNNCVFYVYYSC
jgi:hypothetical protein